MFAPYFQILRAPGALNFTLAGFLGRLALPMTGLGVILFMTGQGYSYGVAGSLAAVLTLVAAFAGPLWGRLMDRTSQHRILPIIGITYALSVGALIAAVTTALPLAYAYAAAAAVGATFPSIGALIRTRWATIFAGTQRLRTAFAFESVLDELVFTIGPPIATILALQLVSYGAIAASALLTLVGALWLASQRSTEPHTTRPAANAPKAPGVFSQQGGVLFGLMVIFFLMGSLFGSYEVAVVAATKEFGNPGAAGLILSLYALGSLVVGLFVGSRSTSWSLAKQLLWATAILAAVSVSFPFANNVLLLSLASLIAGCAVSPVLITGFALAESISLKGRLTETLAWCSSGLAVGLALAATLAGWIIDHYGAMQGFWITSTAPVLGLAVMALMYRRANKDRNSARIRTEY